jgi:hypothetical protein
MNIYKFHWFHLFKLLSPFFVLWLVPFWPMDLSPKVFLPLASTHITVFMVALMWSVNGLIDSSYVWWRKPEEEES